MHDFCCIMKNYLKMIKVPGKNAEKSKWRTLFDPSLL
jgi:hypothetical protein